MEGSDSTLIAYPERVPWSPPVSRRPPRGAPECHRRHRPACSAQSSSLVEVTLLPVDVTSDLSRTRGRPRETKIANPNKPELPAVRSPEAYTRPTAPAPACRAPRTTRRELAGGTARCAETGTEGASDRTGDAPHEAAATPTPGRQAAARPRHHPAVGAPPTPRRRRRRGHGWRRRGAESHGRPA
jgi:hypothetical protein